MFAFKTIKTKLLLLFILLAVVPVLLFSMITYMNTDKLFMKLVSTEQQRATHSLQTQLADQSDELLELTKLYAGNKEVVNAFKTNDQKTLEQTIVPLFKRLEQEQGLTVFELGDSNGTVLFRGHQPQKRGDSKKDKAAIQQALNGQENAGFEFGSSGLAVRAFVPIKDGNKVIGTLQTGLGEVVFTDIANTLKEVDLNLYDAAGQAVIGKEKNNHIKKSVQADVLEGKEVSLYSNQHLQTFLPMYDPTKTTVIGIVKINQDLSVIEQSKQQFVTFILIFGLGVLVVVTLLASIFSRTISNPIKQVTAFTKSISQGKLGVTFTGKRYKDETGQLTVAVEQMRDELAEMIKQVSLTSYTISDKSAHLKQVSHKISEGTHQVAATMEQLSSAVETEAAIAADLSQKMIDFTRRINGVSQSGQDIHSTVGNVYALTEQGKKMMDTSVLQMNDIHEYVSKSVQELNELHDHSKHVSTLVYVIQEIADQTNLLALNAAIEAARAGEHGKGFAVVAHEVRKLAEQVGRSVQNITEIVQQMDSRSTKVAELLKKSFEHVIDGSVQIKQTGEAFNKIQVSVHEVTTKIDSMSRTLEEVQNETKHVNDSLIHIANMAEQTSAAGQQTSASVQQTSSSVEEIAVHATDLASLTVQFEQMLKKFELKER
ncbi:methyl-accepting chemotaxis protein [Priestia megaterium]|nr:methyl-accepting chemotaxis protein [Priestia megaterium]